MTTTETGFVHRFLPAQGEGDPRTLLMLHGTGGDENSLLDLGRELAPQAALLSLRGKVRENGMPRFFRRLAEGVFDQEDLKLRTRELADFLPTAAAQYGFDPVKVIAVGYSNGANIAASLLLTHPDALAGAVLLHPMVPFVPETSPALSGTPIFIGAGQTDPIVPIRQTTDLAAILEAAGAEVSLFWQTGGHNLSKAEFEAARTWLATI